jgi:hypothetical protein
MINLTPRNPYIDESKHFTLYGQYVLSRVLFSGTDLISIQGTDILIPVQGAPQLLLIKVRKMSVIKEALARVCIQSQEDTRVNHV